MSIQVQLSAVGVDIPKQPEGGGDDSAALALTLDMLEMPAEELERRFRDVWGNNADEIRCVHPTCRHAIHAGEPQLLGREVGLFKQGKRYNGVKGFDVAGSGDWVPSNVSRSGQESVVLLLCATLQRSTVWKFWGWDTAVVSLDKREARDNLSCSPDCQRRLACLVVFVSPSPASIRR